MALTETSRQFLVHKWYREELGRLPEIADIATHAKAIDDLGLLAAFLGIYNSTEARKHRKAVGRTV